MSAQAIHEALQSGPQVALQLLHLFGPLLVIIGVWHHVTNCRNPGFFNLIAKSFVFWIHVDHILDAGSGWNIKRL